MIILVLYSLLVAAIFIFAVLLCVYMFFSIVSHFAGSPYVPTSHKEVVQILQKADLKKGKIFLELGSGDGRIVREAAKKYGVRAIGVEIHPLLVWYSRLLTWWQKVHAVTFIKGNFFKTDLTTADTIFLFLLPKTLARLGEKMKRECKNNVQIISHGFKIIGWEKYHIFTLDHRPFPTYFYLLKREKGL
ncbi:MAG TPA: class I SAM-dependent methyltransferase [Patescibacteria group bacterium]|nr:class I SAM-dependent methyltransferase [Patescibacteria group bacterium]